MELREALSQISEIRQQMARSEVFRGLRSVPVAFSGLLAWAAARFNSLVAFLAFVTACASRSGAMLSASLFPYGCQR